MFDYALSVCTCMLYKLDLIKEVGYHRLYLLLVACVWLYVAGFQLVCQSTDRRGLPTHPTV
jgi:hypothetical protein